MKREYQEFTGKTVEEAVRDGLRELGLKEEEADIRVLEEGKKKLFGYVKARVEIAPKGGDEEAEASAEAEEEKEPEERQTTATRKAAPTEKEPSSFWKGCLTFSKLRPARSFAGKRKR